MKLTYAEINYLLSLVEIDKAKEVAVYAENGKLLSRLYESDINKLHEKLKTEEKRIITAKRKKDTPSR